MEKGPKLLDFGVAGQYFLRCFYHRERSTRGGCRWGADGGPSPPGLISVGGDQNKSTSFVDENDRPLLFVVLVLQKVSKDLVVRVPPTFPL